MLLQKCASKHKDQTHIKTMRLVLVLARARRVSSTPGWHTLSSLVCSPKSTKSGEVWRDRQTSPPHNILLPWKFFCSSLYYSGLAHAYRLPFKHLGVFFLRKSPVLRVGTPVGHTPKILSTYYYLGLHTYLFRCCVRWRVADAGSSFVLVYSCTLYGLYSAKSPAHHTLFYNMYSPRRQHNKKSATTKPPLTLLQHK